MFSKNSLLRVLGRHCGAISDPWFARKPEDPRHSTDHDQRKRASTLKQREVVSVPDVQRRAKRASAQSQQTVVYQRRKFTFKVRSVVQNLGQNSSGILPVIVTGSYNSTDSLEGTEQYFYALSPRRRAGASEQFLSYDGAEIYAWRVFIVKFTDERERLSTLDKVDI
jgi:hypothetical protein